MLLDFTKRSSYNKVYLALTIMLFISDIIGQKATTINSITLILLFITLLLEGNFREKANRLYKEPLFYIISCYFLLCLLSIFVSKDVSHAKFIAQREMSIFVVPIIFLSKESFPKRYILFLFKCFIISAFVWMCTATILASNEYITGGDYHVFFYHSLVEKVDSTAIYASMVCIISIILIASVPFPAKLKSFLYLAFTVWIILLSSRMFLFIYTILLVTYIFRLLNGRYRLIAIGISIAVVLTLYMTKNPIKDRFEDLGKFKTAYLSDKKFNNNIYFDGLSLRLLYVRYSFEIMREHHQYFLGVGSGDAAKLLRDKIRQYDMNTGDGSVNNSGYLRYSFHDVYSEAFVSLGLLGLATIVALYAYIGFLGIENKISLLKNIFITVSLSSFTDVIVINNQNDNSLILTIVCLCILLIRSENKTKDIQYIIAAN